MDNNFPLYFSLQFTICLSVQAWLFTAVSSRVVQVESSLDRPTSYHILFNVEENKPMDLQNTSLTTETEDDSRDMGNHALLSRLRRSSHPCELKRVIKWSKCLGRYFTKVYCVKTHFACLPYNAPPKCKKNYHVIFGKTGRACRVLTSCTCG